MARKRKHTTTPSHFRNRHEITRRDDLFIASDLSDGVFEPVSRSLPDPIQTTLNEIAQPAVRSMLSDIEDRRTYHPSGPHRPVSSPRRHNVKIKVKPRTNFRTAAMMVFDAPKYVSICVRRKIRTEVLHAQRKTGKGSRFNRKPRHNENSKVHC